MKQSEDTVTSELRLTRIGRPPKFGRTMTNAERQVKKRRAREIRDAATLDNLRYIAYEVQMLRHAIEDLQPGQNPDLVLADALERLKTVRDAAMGTMAILKLV